MTRRYNYEELLEKFLERLIKENITQFNYIDVKMKLNVGTNTAYKIIDKIVLNDLGTHSYGVIKINSKKVIKWLQKKKSEVHNDY
ncbi:MAG: hypothetical protein ACP5GU_05835 [Thermoprotei archaeon]|jgi:disulfide oxidoreductase YuzD